MARSADQGCLGTIPGMPLRRGQLKPSFHVLVTGYGSFSYVTEDDPPQLRYMNNNPSWLAVAPLHDKLIETDFATIHVTALGPLKVAYSTVLSILPGLHARPPQLPSVDSPDAPMPEPVIEPPSEGYDFIFHLGAGRNGALKIEQIGHKSGYKSPDVDGNLPSVMATDLVLQELSESERLRQGEGSMPGNTVEGTISSGNTVGPLRGYSKGYECFPEELRTEVDAQGLIEHLKQQGETRVIASTDAGRYLCDFICYGSLAESQRPLLDCNVDLMGLKRSKSLFMHVPFEEHKPHTIEEMTDAVRQIIIWVCTKEKSLPMV